MVEIKPKVFKINHYGNIVTYFSNTDDYTIISIPDWNWSFFWSVYEDDDIAMAKCERALEVPMFKDAAEQLVNEIYKFLMKK